MSRTMIISSWPTSNTASTTASGSSWSRAPSSIFPASNPSAERLTRRLLRRPDAPPEHGDPGALSLGPLLRGTLRHGLEQPHQVVLLDGLVLDQSGRDPVERVPFALEDIEGPVVRLVDQPADLGVDLEGHLVRVVGLGGEVPAEEHLTLALAEGQRPEHVGHPVLGDHPPGDLGGPL